jgi:hypothetical protein
MLTFAILIPAMLVAVVVWNAVPVIVVDYLTGIGPWSLLTVPFSIGAIVGFVVWMDENK